jgi:hypothetical protein
MELLPLNDLAPYFYKSLGHSDRARLASVNREFNRLFNKGQEHISDFEKFKELIKGLGRRYRNYVEMAFGDRRGYVLFTVIQRGHRVYYKLDGVSGSPEFDLNSESFDRFSNFVRRHWGDVVDCDVASNNWKNKVNIQGRLRSVFLE